MTDAVDEVREWLGDNWDPDLTVREWWEKLGLAGWVAPTWPEEWYGKGLANADAVRVHRAITEFGALGPPAGLGLLLAGPTIVTHGTDEQKARYLPDIVTGRVGWCQLFSEPVAGSDLAGLQTRAVRDGDEWIVNGQKVWTSSAHIADLGMLVARTNNDVPKHKGLSYFALDMHQPGIEIRPLRELTGRALFNEVFISDARVSNDAIIGGLDNGWAVTNTTLAFERAGLGAGGGGAEGSGAVPGTVVGHLDRRAGSFVERIAGTRRKSAQFSVSSDALRTVVDRAGQSEQRLVRQQLAQLHIEQEIGRYMSLRHRAERAAGRDLPGMGNMAKLRMSQMFRLARELGMSVLGPRGMLHTYEEEGEEGGGVGLPDSPLEQVAEPITALALWSPGPSIYGGTDEVQKNILGERVLGLPREPSDDRTLPFRELRKNA